MFWLIYFLCVGLGSAMLYVMRFSKANDSIIQSVDGYHDTDYTPKVTVLICAINESENLAKNLPFILNQQYPNKEVLVIDHASIDATKTWLDEMVLKHPHLKVVSLTGNENHYTGKKQALYEGYRHASGEIVVLTDADCKPASDQWLRAMVLPFKEEKIELVAGYAPYNPTSGILSDLIQTETIETFTSMKRMAMLGFPYMAIGRNMAVRKSVIQEDYWNKYQSLPFGDDDLLAQTYAHSANYKLVIEERAWVFSEGEKTFGAWMRQKRRHLAAGNFYKPYLIRLLAIVPLARLFLLFAILMALSCTFKNIILICLSIPVVGMYWIQYLNTDKQVRSGVGFVKFFWMHQLLVIYYLIFPILVLFYKKNNWQRNTPYR